MNAPLRYQGHQFTAKTDGGEATFFVEPADPNCGILSAVISVEEVRLYDGTTLYANDLTEEQLAELEQAGRDELEQRKRDGMEP